MLKKIGIIALACFMLLLAACGAPTQAPAENEETPALQTADEAAQAALPEDGQNPVMNFVGNYLCGRASILVEAEGADSARFTVTWGASYNESARWVMSGRFDEETLSVRYTDCVKSLLTYREDGELASEEQLYADGSGVVFFSADEYALTWQDDQENMAEGLEFRGDLIESVDDAAAGGFGEGDPEYYSGLSAMDKAALEEIAWQARTAVLEGDWAAVSGMIRYPIVINGTELADAEAFLRFMSDKTLHESDREALEQENCRDMFYNGQGLCLGDGEVWMIDPGYMTDEEPQLLIFAFNGIVEK